jgi:membrane associated rhomboid family serine protease
MMRLSPVVKNLLIINVAVYLMQLLFSDLDVTGFLSLWNFGSVNFAPYQLFTYMFAHSPGSFMHLMFNMMGLIFLGPLLEQFWGSNRFIIFYLVTGIGAGLFYSGIKWVENNNLRADVEAYTSNPTPEAFNHFVSEHRSKFNSAVWDFVEDYSRNPESEQYKVQTVRIVTDIYNRSLNLGSMLGASGAVYGILMAFGLLFPNLQLMLIFPPIPIRAKYLVLILGGLAIYSGFSNNPGDNVAHFAHLGGMIWAFIMIKYWQTKGYR